MALSGRRIIVIGAGIGGLAAALALARRRAGVTVCEQAPALAEVGAGLQIGPNGVAVLQALGLESDAARDASLPEAVELRDWRSGRRVARLALGADAVLRYGHPYWQFHRADLLALLAAAAAKAGVRIALDTGVTSVFQDGAGMRLTTAAGVELAAEIVVAADGVRSAVRKACFGNGAPRFGGHVAWRGLVAAERLAPGLFPNAACVTMGPGRHIVTYPLRGGRLWNFVAVEARRDWAEEGWSIADDPAALRNAFRGWNPAVEALLAAVDQTFLWGLFDHPPLRAWTRGRLALLGDACHPMLPFLAQGAAMALEDAWVLAAELDAAETPEQGLATYEAKRAPRTRRVQRAAARNALVYHLATPLLRQALHAGLGLASRHAPGAVIGRFDWLYGADVTGSAAHR